MLGHACPVPDGMPQWLMLICAIRTGKSLLASVFATRSALLCDLGHCKPSEPIPRIPVLSVDVDRARIVYDHLKGHIEASPTLSKMLKKCSADSLEIERPDGRLVEIKVTAGARAGASLVGRWLAGAVFDECTLLTGQDDGHVINLESSLTNIKGRLLDGAQVVMIGSTTAPPFGPAYDMLHDWWGNPTQDRVAVWATGPEFLPTRYTEDYCAKLEASEPAVHRVSTSRSFLDPESGFLAPELIESQCKDFVPEAKPRHHYVAAMDPATRSNAWSLVIVENSGGFPNKHRVVRNLEWKAPVGSRLSPEQVMKEIAEECKAYDIDVIYTDRHMADALIDFGSKHGLGVLPVHLHAQVSRDAYLNLERMLLEQTLELPRDPLLRRDLTSIRKKTTQAGELAFSLPKTSDGRHCDYAPALVRALMHLAEPPEEEEQEEQEDDKFWKKELEQMRKPGNFMEKAMNRIVS